MYTTSMTPEKALAGFGLGCAQHVFGEFAPQLGLDRETALKIAALFGSGMFEGASCGAVVGGLMAIGLRFGQGDNPDPERQELIKQKGEEFKARFAAKYGSRVCSGILGHKLPEELEQIEAENKFVTVCSRAISDACEICADILNEKWIIRNEYRCRKRIRQRYFSLIRICAARKCGAVQRENRGPPAVPPHAGQGRIKRVQPQQRDICWGCGIG